MFPQTTSTTDGTSPETPNGESYYIWYLPDLQDNTSQDLFDIGIVTKLNYDITLVWDSRVGGMVFKHTQIVSNQTEQF